METRELFEKWMRSQEKKEDLKPEGPEKDLTSKGPEKGPDPEEPKRSMPGLDPERGSGGSAGDMFAAWAASVWKN